MSDKCNTNELKGGADTQIEPPTKIDKYCDVTNKRLLNLLLLLICFQVLYQEFYIGIHRYEVIPKEYEFSGSLYVQKTNYTLITEEQYKALTRPYDNAELLGIIGIVLYLSVQLSQKWYRERAIRKWKKVFKEA